MLQNTEQLRTLLIEKILNCIDGSAPKDYIPEIAKLFNKKSELQNDIPLLQRVTLLDFLAKQIASGNEDLISKKLIRESYTYILDNLMSNVRHA